MTLLILAIRRHRGGDRTVWLTSVTAYPWFGNSDEKPRKSEEKALPPPVTADSHHRSKSGRSGRSGRSQSRVVHQRYENKELPEPRRHGSTRRGPTHNEEPTYVHWMPHKVPDPTQLAVVRSKPTTRDPYHRDASPRR